MLVAETKKETGSARGWGSKIGLHQTLVDDGKCTSVSTEAVERLLLADMAEQGGSPREGRSKIGLHQTLADDRKSPLEPMCIVEPLPLVEISPSVIRTGPKSVPVSRLWASPPGVNIERNLT